MQRNILGRLVSLVGRLKFRYIIKGWSSYALDCFDMLDEQTKKESQRRVDTCRKCPMITKRGLCGICSCPVVMKSYTESQCELNKW